MSCIRKHSRRAFTLVELMLAVTLLALLTGAAALAFAHPVRQARARQAMETITHADAMAREQAIRFGRLVRVVFDLRHHEIQCGSMRSRLPAGYSIREMRGAGSSESIVDISALGLSRSYALHLVGPELDQWLIVAGLSGEMMWTSDETKVTQILTAGSRNDAH